MGETTGWGLGDSGAAGAWGWLRGAQLGRTQKEGGAVVGPGPFEAPCPPICGEERPTYCTHRAPSRGWRSPLVFLPLDPGGREG